MQWCFTGEQMYRGLVLDLQDDEGEDLDASISVKAEVRDRRWTD